MFVLYVALKKDFLENTRILSGFVQLKSVLFNLLCVVDVFRLLLFPLLN